MNNMNPILLQLSDNVRASEFCKLALLIVRRGVYVSIIMIVRFFLASTVASLFCAAVVEAEELFDPCLDLSFLKYRTSPRANESFPHNKQNLIIVFVRNFCYATFVLFNALLVCIFLVLQLLCSC